MALLVPHTSHGPARVSIVRNIATGALILLISLLIAAAMTGRQVSQLEKDGKVVSSISGHYQFVHPDAWHHLRLARDLKEGRYGDRDPLTMRPLPHPPSPLVEITAALSGPTERDLERTAFFSGPVLAWCMIFAFLAWGFVFGSGLTALVGWLAGAVSIYWMQGTAPGTFDTHAANALFPYLTAFFLYQAAKATGRVVNPVWLLAAVAASAAAWLWWKPGGLLCAGLMVFYAMTIVRPSPAHERILKFLILCVALGAAGLHLAGYGHLLPTEVRDGFVYLESHLRLVLGGEAHAPEMAGTVIDELTPTPFVEMATGLCGSVLGFCVCCLGVLAMFAARPGAAFFLLPFALLGAFSFYSFRFFIFLLPLLGLGLGFLADRLRILAREKVGAPALGAVLVAVLVLGILAPGLKIAAVHPTENSVIPPYMHALAVKAREVTPPDAVLWTWWSEGYFFQYVANRATFFDGGSQTPLKNFIAGFALSCGNPELSANWIKFFTRTRGGGLARLSKDARNPAQAIDFLLETLAGSADLKSAAAKYGIRPVPNMRRYLFPKAKAFVCLPYNTINSNFWYRAGMWRDRFNPNAVVLTLPKRTTPADPARQAVLVGDRPVRYDLVVRESEPGPLPQGFSGRLLIVGAGDSIHLVDHPVYDSLAYRLLGPGGFPHPGFETLYRTPDVGGIWRVE